MPGRTLGDVGKGVLPPNIFCCRSKNDLYIRELSANLTRKSYNLEKYKITKYNTSGAKKNQNCYTTSVPNKRMKVDPAREHPP